MFSDEFPDGREDLLHELRRRALAVPDDGLFDPLFAMKDAHVADDTGTQCGTDPYFVQLDKVRNRESSLEVTFGLKVQVRALR